MLPNSAFITVGEPVERVMQAKKKEAPNGEFASIDHGRCLGAFEKSEILQS